MTLRLIARDLEVIHQINMPNWIHWKADLNFMAYA